MVSWKNGRADALGIGVKKGVFERFLVKKQFLSGSLSLKEGWISNNLIIRVKGY